jgi:hypothetical protein
MISTFVWRTCAPISVRLLALTAFAAGCHGQKEAANPEPREAAPTSSVSVKKDCVVPTTDALARFDGITESDISLRHDIDFNDDGQTDAIVRVQSGSEPTHLIYIRKRGCIRFLDKIEAFKIGCEEDAESNGYCILWVDKFEHHGDRRRSTMSFVDGAYKPTAETELIPGSRDRPE